MGCTVGSDWQELTGGTQVDNGDGWNRGVRWVGRGWVMEFWPV